MKNAHKLRGKYFLIAYTVLILVIVFLSAILINYREKAPEEKRTEEKKEETKPEPIYGPAYAGGDILARALELLGEDYSSHSLVQMDMLAGKDKNNELVNISMDVEVQADYKSGYGHEATIGMVRMGEQSITIGEEAYITPDGIRFSRSANEMLGAGNGDKWTYYVNNSYAKNGVINLDSIDLDEVTCQLVQEGEESWYMVNIPIRALSGDAIAFAKENGKEKLENNLSCYAKILTDGTLQGIYAAIKDGNAGTTVTEENSGEVEHLQFKTFRLATVFSPMEGDIVIPDEVYQESGYR